MNMVKALVTAALVLGISSSTFAEVSEPRLITTTGNAGRVQQQ